MDNYYLKKDLSTEELFYVQSEMNKYQSSSAVAWILWIFFGFWGVHCFYLGNVGKGVAYIIINIISLITLFILIGFIGYFILLILWIVDAVNIERDIALINSEKERAIISSLYKK